VGTKRYRNSIHDVPQRTDRTIPETIHQQNWAENGIRHQAKNMDPTSLPTISKTEARPIMDMLNPNPQSAETWPEIESISFLTPGDGQRMAKLLNEIYAELRRLRQEVNELKSMSHHNNWKETIWPLR
jgi:hypothetical protein